MNLPPHLEGVLCTRATTTSRVVVIRPVGKTETGAVAVEQLWDTLNRREQHDLMMIALIEPDGAGDDTTVVAQIGDFRLWGDGEIYYCPEEKCDE